MLSKVLPVMSSSPPPSSPGNDIRRSPPSNSSSSPPQYPSSSLIPSSSPSSPSSSTDHHPDDHDEGSTRVMLVQAIRGPKRGINTELQAPISQRRFEESGTESGELSGALTRDSDGGGQQEQQEQGGQDASASSLLPPGPSGPLSPELVQASASTGAARNWKKLKFATKMASAFQEVHDEVKMYGSTANDDHIDWKQVYNRSHNGSSEASRDTCLTSIPVIDPNGFRRMTWDIYMVFILLYVAFYVPYRVCLYWDDETLSEGLRITENFTDLCFGIDLLLNFNTAYNEPKTGFLIRSRRKIAKHYLRGFFFIDFIASFPFGLFLENGSTAKSLNKAGKLSRLPRLFKFMRLIRLLKLLRIYRIQQFIHKLETHFSIHHGVSRMVKIIFVVCLVTHIVACAWFLVGVSGGDDPFEGGWQWRYGFHDKPLPEQYVAGLYWAISTLATVGYGDISGRTVQEQLYAMLMMLLGVSWYAYIVSSMAHIMASFDRKATAISEKMNAVNMFIQDAHLPTEIAKQIRAYYEFAMSNRGGARAAGLGNQYDADQILGELSSGLRADVVLFVEQKLISKIPFFKDKIPQFISDCIAVMQPMVFQEGDFIIKEGSAADEMYFLIKGRCAVYYGSKKMVSIIEGSYFGEIGCIMGGIRRAGIKATTICELQALSRRNLNVLLAEYPDVGEELKRVAKSRMHTVRSSSIHIKQVESTRKILSQRLSGQSTAGEAATGSPTAGGGVDGSAAGDRTKGESAASPSPPKDRGGGSSPKPGQGGNHRGLAGRNAGTRAMSSRKGVGGHAAGGGDGVDGGGPGRRVLGREMSVTTGFGKAGTGTGVHHSPEQEASEPNVRSRPRRGSTTMDSREKAGLQEKQMQQRLQLAEGVQTVVNKRMDDIVGKAEGDLKRRMEEMTKSFLASYDGEGKAKEGTETS